MIAKFRYHSENSVIAKIEIFAMHSNFRYDSENSNIANFGTVPHWLLFHWLLFPLLPAATHLIHVFFLSFPFSDIYFF